MFKFLLLLSITTVTYQQGTDTFTCMKFPSSTIKRVYVIKPRRYDIGHMGSTRYFRGWADVQGQGAANDFCRIVGNSKSLYLVCALAGTSGASERNYISAPGFDPGYKETWFMRDQDGDGRDDYCRCAKDKTSNSTQVWCTKAGANGFFGSKNESGEELTFPIVGTTDCENRKVYPEFGELYQKN